LQANRLKLVPRAGWAMRGIVDPESVSDHTFGVAFIALVLAESVEQPVDRTKLLTMALLHDLPEVVLGDIPSPAARYLPPDAKTAAERDVLAGLLDGLACCEQWQRWWREYEEQATIEGRLIHDADRLDMLLQAHVYEQTTGNQLLEEFWMETTRASFNCEPSRSLFDALCQARQRAGDRS
jgi:putative hydrolase of HD superfamily